MTDKNPNKRVKNVQNLAFSLTALRKLLEVVVACLKECYYKLLDLERYYLTFSVEIAKSID